MKQSESRFYNSDAPIISICNLVKRLLHILLISVTSSKIQTLTDKASFMKNKNKAGVGIALGIAIGTAVGVATGNLGLWLALGIALGAGAGTVMNKKENKEE